MSSTEDPFANSPLGQDPADEAVEENTPEQETESVDVQEPRKITLTEEEYEEMQAKVSNFETIASDTNAMQLLTDYYKGVNVGKPDMSEENTGDDSDYGTLIKRLTNEIDAIKSVGAQIQEQMGSLVLANFAQQNPDFDQYRVRVGQVMREYPGIPLDKAYRLAKAESGQPSQDQNSQQRVNPTRPVAETNSVGQTPEVKGFTLEDAERRIADPKAVKSFDQALKEAVSAAKQYHGVR